MTSPSPDDTPTTRLPRVEGADRDRETDEIPAARTERRDGEKPPPTLLDQMGGISGIVSSTVPVAVFVVVNVITELRPALIAAIVAGVAVMVWRLIRRDPIQPAISGLIGVGVCAFVANQTGEARGFYLPGLLYSAFIGLVALVSVVVRWPLAGVIWHGINGHGQGWRSDSRLLRAYTWATGIWVVVFTARVLVQGWLYDANAENALGIARLAMGYPLFGVAILATVLIVRRAERTPAPATGTA